MVQPLHIPRRIIDISVGLPSGAAGSLRQYDTAFEVESWARSRPNKATVKVYNLAESSIRYLETNSLILTVNAGDDVPGQLFQGAISRDGVSTKNNGPDWVTTIEAADGRRAYRDAIFSRSYPPGTALNLIIQDIGIAMNKPVTVAATLPTFAIPSGWTFSTKARAALDEVLLPFGLGWSIINGVLYILDPLAPLPGNAPLITPQSGLMGSPERTKRGVKLKARLNPAIVPGKGIVLKSKLLSGTYRNEHVIHRGEKRGPTWETSTEGVKV